MDSATSDSKLGSDFAVLPVRSSRSCTECTRRKIKCDRGQPCSACSKGGRAHACSAPARKRQPGDLGVVLDERRTAALSELKLFRETLASLQARIPNLEHFVANSGPGEGDDQEDMPYLSGFGNPITKLAPRASEEGSSAPGRTRPREDGQGAGEPERKRIKEGSVGTDGDEGDVAAVETTVDLEFMTLGRPRNISTAAQHQQASAGQLGASLPSLGESSSSILASSPSNPSPVVTYSDPSSLAAAAPTLEEEQVIFGQAFEYGWHHSVVHAGTFASQVATFHELGEQRFEMCLPAWLSLYFALLAISTKLIDQSRQHHLGWSEEQTASNAAAWFECSISCLYRHNFLQNHDFFTLQTISLLVLSGRDAGSAALIASLLSSGLSIAQDLNLHRQPSDAEWDMSMRGKPTEIRAKALIDREIRKRVLWALAHSDWFAIPFRSSWILGRARITTPLPLNCTDEDLATGTIIDRPDKEYTVVAWLRQYIELGSCVQAAFAEIDYEAFLKIDTQLEAILADLPPWLRPGGDSTGMPPACVEVMRSTFVISVQHKLISVHRRFLAKKNKAAYAVSRRRVVVAARAILREGARVRGNRLWTVLYHLSVALFSITLELFEQLKAPSAEADAMRAEVYEALPTLEGLRQASSIADRGLALVLPLLEEEKRLKAEGDKKRPRKPKPATAPPPSIASNPETPHQQHQGLEGAAPSASSHLHYPLPHLAGTSISSDSTSPGGAQPSPEAFPAWYFQVGDGWLDSQLSGAAPTPEAGDGMSHHPHPHMPPPLGWLPYPHPPPPHYPGMPWGEWQG